MRCQRLFMTYIGHDIRMIITRKNMVNVRLLVAIKEKQLHKIKIAQKISRFRSTLPYLSSEYRNLRHAIPLTISFATTVPNLFWRVFLVSIFNFSM